MLNKLIKTISAIADDLFLITGIGLLSYGMFSIYIPAGYITLGICCIAVAFFVAKRVGRNGL